MSAYEKAWTQGPGRRSLERPLAQVPYYEYALDLILDLENPHAETLTEEQHELVEQAAETLYGTAPRSRARGERSAVDPPPSGAVQV